MKKLLPIFFLLTSLYAGAQSLVLTQSANEPIVGDIESVYDLDTTLYSNGLNVSLTGTNTLWDYSHLRAITPMFNTVYIDTSLDTNSASFPGCTVVQDDGFLQTFLKSATTPTTQTEVLGFVTNTMSVTFTNSAIAVKYPVSYGTTSNDNMAGSFSAFSLTGSCSGNVSTKADGTGTLALPGVTLTNVLRVKSTQTITFNQGFIPIATLKQTLYNFYHASKKFAIISISYQSFGLITSSSPSVTAGVTGNADLFTPVSVDIKEITAKASGLSVYPNPFTSGITLDVDAQLHPQQIRLYSQLGQLVFNKEYSRNPDLQSLPNGIYLAEISTAQGILRTKLIKE